MTKECDGCNTENWCHEHGYLDNECPCCACLVKPVCKSACIIYYDFTNERESKIKRERMASQLEGVRK